jgi:uncharacterized protein DUF4386
VPGDAQATADSILSSRWLFGSSLVTWLAVVVADVAIAVTFYLLLRPVSHTLSLLAAALRLVYAAVLAAMLVNLFGVHLLTLGWLRYRSRYLPRVLGALLVAAGVGYIADSLAGLLLADHGGLVSAVLLTPAVLGEFGLTAWLLLRGVRVPRPATRQAG